MSTFIKQLYNGNKTIPYKSKKTDMRYTFKSSEKNVCCKYLGISFELPEKLTFSTYIELFLVTNVWFSKLD